MKHLLLLVFVVFQLNAFSQDLKSKFQIGGTGMVFKEKTTEDYALLNYGVRENSDFTSISIYPQLGYFITNRILIGGRIGYVNEMNDQIVSQGSNTFIDNVSKTIIYKIGPYARFHKPINDQMFLFLQSNIDFGFGTGQNQNGAFIVEENVFQFEAGLRPGFLVLLSEKVGVEGTFGFIGYRLNQTKLIGSNANSNSNLINKDQDFGVDMNLSSFNIGIQFYF